MYAFNSVEHHFLLEVIILQVNKFQVIAEHLSVEEVAGIKEMFDMMDSNKNGKITFEELKMGLRRIGHQVPDSDVHMLMEAVSVALTSSFLWCSFFLPFHFLMFCPHLFQVCFDN